MKTSKKIKAYFEELDSPYTKLVVNYKGITITITNINVEHIADIMEILNNIYVDYIFSSSEDFPVKCIKLNKARK